MNEGRGARILVIEDDDRVRSNVVEFLLEEGYEVLQADNGTDGLALITARVPELVICDIMLPGIDGYDVLEKSREQIQELQFVFLTAKAERADMRKGMRLGADDYLTKPFTLVELLEAVRTRLRRNEEVLLRAKAAAAAESEKSSRAPVAPFQAADGVVVLDPKLREIYDRLARIAPSNMSVLILGERGVGKDILARAVHDLSPRSKGPFMAHNCAALTESLLETELFGSEKGAFTGAIQRPGLFEAASGGTVFLDEVGELPPSIQAALLRVLEDCKVMRVGARVARHVDVRFVAATNRNLDAEIARGSFRADLYDRINAVAFTIPPLRERRLEVAPLARMFVARAAAELGKSGTPALSPQCLQLLESYPWPGNVRELKNAMQLAVALCEGDTVRLDDLPPKVRDGHAAGGSASGSVLNAREQLRRQVDEEERLRILDVLGKTGGNQTRAAELLGIARRTLLYRMKSLGIDGPRKRHDA